MSTTKLGRNILHVAAANGRNKCIDLLLHRGAGELEVVQAKFVLEFLSITQI